MCRKAKTCIIRGNKNRFTTTNNLFRVAYKIGKMGRPFMDLPVECDVQKLNGVDIGTTLQSDKSCQAVVEHIGIEMRSKVCNLILNGNSTKLSIIIDESTSISKASVLIIYIKVCLPNGEALEMVPCTFYLDIVELDNQGAEFIVNSPMKCLEEHGFTQQFLSEKLICFAASVVLGSRSGVATRIQDIFPSVITWHCMNHRLELAVGDTIDKVTATNHFKMFFDKLYCLYHTSPKNRRELEECCYGLAIEFNTIGRILDTHWVASSFCTVKVVWDLNVPLHSHLLKASNDRSRNSTERNIFNNTIRYPQSIFYLTLEQCTIV